MTSKKVFAFGRINFIVLAVGMAIVILGMVLMSGSGSDETRFNPDIFSTTRIKVAPVVCLLGYLTMAVGIILRPNNGKAKDEDNQPQAVDNVKSAAPAAPTKKTGK